MGNLKLLAAVGLAGLMGVFGAGPALAQEEVRLSAVELVESKNTIDHITQTDFERKTATNLWEALKGVLGVYQTTSAGRNEGTISIRGTTRDQVGMFIDDIPVGTSYRNEWDANNTMLYDLESIEVSKGYSSPLLISNNGLGGVINLRTAKPTKELEFSTKYMNFFDRDFDDQGRLFAASIGTKQELFYLKATATYKGQDFFTLPSSFTAAPNEDGGRRNNSDSKNKALNLIAGWTPTEDVDIMFGFVRQSMEKGQPPDAAPTSTGGTWERFWRWPEYETTRYYVNANVNLTEQAHLKAVVYNDEHKDTTWGYKGDPTFVIRKADMNGTYDQYTRGGQLTFDYTFNEANKLAVSAGYRQLSHKNFDETDNTSTGIQTPGLHLTEDYYDFGAEYTLKPIDPLTLVFGASSSTVKPGTLETYISGSGTWGPYLKSSVGSKNLFNYQVGAFYDLTENHELFATFAKKSRFPSMRERYQRDSLANSQPAAPDLDPEHAYHYELGYRGLIQDWLKINSSIFYSDVKDKIDSINTSPASPCGGTASSCYQNVNKAEFYGFELGAEALVNQYFSAGLTFNYLEWTTEYKDRNGKDTDVNLTQLPKVTSTVYAVVSPLEGLSIIPQVNMSSSFYWNSSPTATSYKESGGFATADLKVVYDLNEHLTFELGARNIFDKEYAYSAYYPEPGRSFFLGVTGRY
jgi:iron complex outermembrane receptor protein